MLEGVWEEGMGAVGEWRGPADAKLERSPWPLASLAITSPQGRRSELSCLEHHKGDAGASLVQLLCKHSLLHIRFF